MLLYFHVNSCKPLQTLPKNRIALLSTVLLRARRNYNSLRNSIVNMLHSERLSEQYHPSDKHKKQPRAPYNKDLQRRLIHKCSGQELNIKNTKAADFSDFSFCFFIPFCGISNNTVYYYAITGAHIVCGILPVDARSFKQIDASKN